MWPEAQLVDDFLRGARRRLVLARAVEGAAGGTLLALLLTLGGVRSPVALVLAIGVPIVLRTGLGDVWRWGWWRSLSGVAKRLEQRTNARNIIVTAAELPRDHRTYVNDVVMKRATQVAAGLQAPTLVPVRKPFAMLLLGSVALAIAYSRQIDLTQVVDRNVATAGEVAINQVAIRIVPPAYSGLPTETASNEPMVDVLANSTVEMTVTATAVAVQMETLLGVRDLAFSDGAFRGRFTAQADGFIALEPRDSAGTSGARRLIGLKVREDRAPRVTLTAPGRDLFFSTVPRAVDVVVSAEDDLALDSLQLRYTAVSGSGERFTFVERSVPLSLTRTSARSWTARGSWALDQLELAPGDLVVYRAIARDRRPGAVPVESDSYVIEVVTPGAIAAEGFAADDQRDRYAASQQMIILKTERLIARRQSMAADSVSGEAHLLAAEQRQVRAEFVFMMGGEIEDAAGEASGTLEVNEVAEAEAEGDILAGRLANQGRIEMTRALRAMSRANAALTDVDLDRALRDERTALDNLMRAFSRSRFILRALTQRERIDLARRLSGSLNLTAGLSGPAALAAPSPRVVALRELLAGLAALSGSNAPATRSRVVQAALALVRADPADAELRQIAARVTDLAQQRRPVSASVDSTVRRLTGLIATALPLSPNVRASLTSDALAGLLRDAARAPGRR